MNVDRRSAVVWKDKVDKQLRQLPKPIRLKFADWVHWVSTIGVRAVRKRPGLHDEPLQGARFGQRSVKLNRAYRLFYIEHRNEHGTFLEVIEVNKHDY